MDYVKKIDPCDLYDLLVLEIETLDFKITNISADAIPDFVRESTQILATLKRAGQELDSLRAATESAHELASASQT